MLAVMKTDFDGMTKAEAVRRAGSQTALAEMLGITKQAVSRWGYEMPLLQVYRLREIKPGWFRKRKVAA
jgi:hypothetical protein